MQYVRCPQSVAGKPRYDRSVFLAGGISNCRDWQTEMVSLLRDTELVVVNPRREVFDLDDPNMSKEQIAWEFNHLQWCNARLFWFSPETLCPITLFELGKYCRLDAPLFVGADPNYRRLFDIKFQLQLERPCEISLNLRELADRVIHWSENV